MFYFPFFPFPKNSSSVHCLTNQPYKNEEEEEEVEDEKLKINLNKCFYQNVFVKTG